MRNNSREHTMRGKKKPGGSRTVRNCTRGRGVERYDQSNRRGGPQDEIQQTN